MKNVKARNSDAALRIHGIAGFEGKVGRVKKVRQGGVECGEALCHYAELELREGTGEGWGSVQEFTTERRRDLRKIETLKDAAVGKEQRIVKVIE